MRRILVAVLVSMSIDQILYAVAVWEMGCSYIWRKWSSTIEKLERDDRKPQITQIGRRRKQDVLSSRNWDLHHHPRLYHPLPFPPQALRKPSAVSSPFLLTAPVQPWRSNEYMRYIKFARTLTFFGFWFTSCAPFSLLLLLLFSSSDDEDDDEDTANRLATKALQMNLKLGSTAPSVLAFRFRTRLALGFVMEAFDFGAIV